MTPFQRFLVRFSAWGFAALALAWVVVGDLVGAPRAAGSWIPLFMLAALVSAMAIAWGRWLRERFVREGALPVFLKRKLREACPGLSAKDCDLAERGLRQFFFACVRSGKKPVAMPSKLVEHLWRAFAADAAIYERWCDAAFGRVIAPTAAQSLGSDADVNDALRRAWYWACKDEAIKPKTPTRLPILFALDAKLAVLGGIVYKPARAAFARAKASNEPGGSGGEVYFGTSFSSSDHSGDHDCFGGADSSSGGSDGGGDGGGGGGD